jgi:hypothetical protein
MRVGFEHFGQSVLFEVSIIFLRSAVFAIFAMFLLNLLKSLGLRTRLRVRKGSRRLTSVNVVR